MGFCSYCKNGNTTTDGNGQKLVFDRQELYKDFPHVWLFKPIRADAFAGHPRAALTALLLVPNPFRVVFAHPTQAETNGTFRVDHETRRMGCWR
jgi:hypothetical protein